MLFDDTRPRRTDPSSPQVLVRTDAAGATHRFAVVVRARGCGFSFGFTSDATVRQAILALPDWAWGPAITAEGKLCDHGEVTELTGLVELSAGLEGSRLIARRQRAHPAGTCGAPTPAGTGVARSTDNPPPPPRRARGRPASAPRTPTPRAARFARSTCVTESTPGSRTGSVAARPAGCGPSPARTTTSTKSGGNGHGSPPRSPGRRPGAALAPAHCEPATFRDQMCSVAGRLTRHGRTWLLHLDRTWPRATHLTPAFARLRTAPWPA